MTLNDFLQQFVITIKLQNEGGVLDVQSAPCRFTEQQQDQAQPPAVCAAQQGLV